MSGALNHPIRGEFDADLRIIEADAALRRLHIRTGGQGDGSLAVGPLANLARQCLTFRSRLSRHVRVSDGDQLLALWAECEPSDTGVRLTITSWQSVAELDHHRPFGVLKLQNRSDKQSAVRDGILLQLDSALIIRGHSALASAWIEDCPIGQPLTAAFIVEDEGDAVTLPLLSAVAERSAFVDKPVTARDSRRAYLLTGQPLWDAQRSFAGYACTLRVDRDAPELAASGGLWALSGGNFGRDLAPVLRQPVGRIIANAETIAAKMHGALREGYADYAGDIANAARHLRSLIDDMTDLEAVESAAFRPADDPIDLADVARRVAGLLSVKASDHQVRLIMPHDGETAPAIGEFRRVLQIVLNLVGNAIRYSPDGTNVTLQVESAAGTAILRVIDQGGGIAEGDRERIFAKFERLGRHDDGGSGLGLYISRRIATALKGQLDVEYSGPEGSCFRLILPARA
jgi:Histidine kinase-, DNA gyrase B-, and HSP90-like ATPase